MKKNMNSGDRQKLNRAIQKELISIDKTEAKLQKKANADTSKYKALLKNKVPQGLNQTLEKAFSTAFGIVFKYGTDIIEKSYDKEDLSRDFSIYDYAIDLKCNRKELRKLNKKVKKSDFKNASIATIEGVGLGVLGIGLPDIVLFIGMVLKGICEVSLNYGYSYDSLDEKYFILKLMSASLASNNDWEIRNHEIDGILNNLPTVDADMFERQSEDTARQFAADMLVLKFIQGIPVIGVVGGAFNPIYYNKIMNYARLKYYKRYLNDKRHEMEK